MNTRNGMLCALIVGLLSATQPLGAQTGSTTCGLAVAQLQSYVGQVNAFASAEFQQGIPYRCQGNPSCMNWWLVQLNGWYTEQARMVNGWYSQLNRECTDRRPGSRDRRVRVRRPTADDPGELDEEVVDDMEVDDEDRTVRIRIPDSPRGFRR